jgi:S-adenosylmethionine:tRNA ribosyltransferase-isomerase
MASPGVLLESHPLRQSQSLLNCNCLSRFVISTVGIRTSVQVWTLRQNPIFTLHYPMGLIFKTSPAKLAATFHRRYNRPMTISLAQFTYSLPKNLIAQAPATPRDHSRLMLVNRQTQQISHHHFYDLAELLTPNDVLVLNQTKVFPARLFGTKPTGGKVEILLLNPAAEQTWQALSHPGLKTEGTIQFGEVLSGTVKETSNRDGVCVIEFNHSGPKLMELFFKLGHTPLPPYIKNDSPEQQLRQEYQTTYAHHLGSVAAPTAGLHFSDELLQRILNRGIQLEYVTLHVGMGTFHTPTPENIRNNALHAERYIIDRPTADRVNAAKQNGKRIIAVGTTSTRTLETAVNADGLITPQDNETQLLISPSYQFKFVDSLITNFHLPESSLLMLISALVSAPNTAEPFSDFRHSLVGMAYQKAIEKKYRFYSFGDAMWIT